ncbi:hypothetical protein DV451_004725 [Geotrichum candidum]|uniref:Mediator of RNA polymerase II transcription subunit 20 n=1 Tax=Geotrichum candidum TaxID=1173061 RepID=A0A9P5G1A0_GEOCN|nr:hypothetical protein DV451_004725 [Geotrichum candidum]KAF5105285.1 hypothetical protein DV453_004984 [Geotrichum candidum]
MPRTTSKYGFEIKLYKDKSAPLATTNSNSFLHTLTSSVPFSPSSNTSSGAEMAVLVNGKATLVAGQFEAILSTKLQGLWQLRQSIRGDGSVFYFETNGNTSSTSVGGETCYNIKLANMMLQGNFKGLVAEIDLMLPDEPIPGNHSITITNSSNNGTTNSAANNGAAATAGASGLTVEQVIDRAREILTASGLLKSPTGPPLPSFVTATTTGNAAAAAAAAAATTTTAAGVAEFNIKNVVLGPKLKAAAASKAPVTDFSRLDTVAQYVELIS